jgi:competence protein ComEC
VRRWIARVALVLLTFGGVGIPAAPSLADVRSAQERVNQDPKTTTVYVTRTGKKYHRAGCRYLSQSKIPMSLAEAAKHYGPCSVCKPPVLK